MKRNILLLIFLTTAAIVPAQRRAVSILGDSYSTFEGYLQPDTNAIWYYAKPDTSRTDVNDVRQTWWWQYVKRNNLKLCRNNSFSGATISYRGYRGEDYRDRSFITRLPNLGCPDLIIVFGATNDCWAGVPLGDFIYTEAPDSSLYTFRPAMARMLDLLKLHYPGTEIVVLINSVLTKEIKDSMHRICEHYQVNYIDLKDLDLKNSHPTIRGHKQICEQIEEVLNPDNESESE